MDNEFIKKCEPNTGINVEFIKKLVRYLYYVTLSVSETDCDKVKLKLSSLWTIIYSAIALLLLLSTLCIMAACVNLCRKLSSIGTKPPTYKDVEKMLVNKYNPEKANDYINYFEQKKRPRKAHKVTEAGDAPKKPVVKKKVVKEDEEEEELVVEEVAVENKGRGDCKPDANIPQRFYLDKFLDSSNDAYVYYRPPQACEATSNFPLSAVHDYEFRFPAGLDEYELYMKLLLAQLASQNQSVENSKVYKLSNELKTRFRPRRVYRKALICAAKQLKRFKK